MGLVEFKRLQTYFKSNKATKSKSPHTDWQGSMASEPAQENLHTRYRDTEGYEVFIDTFISFRGNGHSGNDNYLH